MTPRKVLQCRKVLVGGAIPQGVTQLPHLSPRQYQQYRVNESLGHFIHAGCSHPWLAE